MSRMSINYFKKGNKVSHLCYMLLWYVTINNDNPKVVFHYAICVFPVIGRNSSWEILGEKQFENPTCWESCKICLYNGKIQSKTVIYVYFVLYVGPRLGLIGIIPHVRRVPNGGRVVGSLVIEKPGKPESFHPINVPVYHMGELQVLT